jgi:hypothetical protein
MSSAPQEILDLVERFAHNLDYYHRPDYNETQARREFIDPLFMALGWDVDNRKGVAPRYQEVIHEATLREREAIRAPDYCFRVGPERKFFVEAKKPAVNIYYDIHPAFQLRRYAWTAKLPLSILTDFEEFSVYDCQVSPSRGGDAPASSPLPGGFDVVIGNPPYIRIQTMKEWAPREVELYKEHYRAASKGNYDIYVVFVEKGLSLLNAHGRLGFILPHKFFNAQYGVPLRQLISKGRHLAEVVHFGDQQVFENATTYTCLLFLDKAGREACNVQKVSDFPAWLAHREAVAGIVPAARITESEWNFAFGSGADLFQRLSEMPVKLGDVAERMAQGIRTSANEVYVLDLVSAGKGLVTAHSKQLDRDVELEREAIFWFLQGREIKPYRIEASGKIVIVPYCRSSRLMELIPENDLRESLPKTWQYLRENKAYLEQREKGRFRGPQWYMYGRQQNIDLMFLPKILVPDIADRASFALDEKGEYAFTSGYGITIKSNVRESAKYVLGLLNSRTLDFYLKRVSTTIRGGFFRYFTQFVEQLPIRPINFSDPADRARHEQMVELVERMLDLHKRLAAAKTPPDRTALQRQVVATDKQIDRLVYELYGLTEEEIGIVEGS